MIWGGNTMKYKIMTENRKYYVIVAFTTYKNVED